MGSWNGGAGHPAARPRRRRTGVPRAHRPVPARAAGALLPDTRLADRRRGHAAGDAAGGLARAGRIPGALVGAVLAVPHRDQPVPQRAARRPSARPGRAGPSVPAARTHPPRRYHLAAALPRHPARRHLRHRARPGRPLPGHRGDRTGLCGRAAAHAAAPGRHAPAARRARLRDRRGGPHAGYQPDRGQGHPAARPRGNGPTGGIKPGPDVPRGRNRRPNAPWPGVLPTRTSPPTSTA